MPEKKNPYDLAMERCTRLSSTLIDIKNIAFTDGCTDALLIINDWLRKVETIQRQIPKVKNLVEFKGYRFAVVDPTTGAVRTASYDEAMRLMMGFYPREEGSALNIVRKHNREEAANLGESTSSS